MIEKIVLVCILPEKYNSKLEVRVPHELVYMMGLSE